MALALPGWAQNVLTGAGIVVLVAFVRVYYRATLPKKTIEAQNDAIKALQDNVGALERRRDQDTEIIDASRKEIERLTQRNQVLEDLAKGTSRLAEFQQQMIEIEHRQERQHEDLLRQGRSLVRAVQKLHLAVNGKPATKKQVRRKRAR